MDDAGQQIANSYQQDIAINERRMRDALALPADLLPVNAYQIAYYRKRYLESLAAHNVTLGELSQMLATGGQPVLDAWVAVHTQEGSDG